MAIEIKVKKIGMSMAPITLVEWTVKEGDWVEQGSIVLVIETEKIRQDIEARASGFLHIIVKEGNNAPIGSVVGLIAETKEELETIQKEMPAEVPITVSEPEEIPQVEVTAPGAAKTKQGRILISPLARKLAEKHMIDISKVVGSGPEGRIVKEDIEREIEAKASREAARAAAASMIEGIEVEHTLPLTGTRQAIAEHLHRSLSISAQVTAMAEIDMTEVVKLREALVSREETLGTRITYTDLVISAVAKVLREYPTVNASIIDDEIKVWKNVNIAVAVDVEAGLLVPVVKNADQKTLVEISKEVKTLAQKARERTLTLEEVKGGTFTISNLGALSGGWRFDTLIINQPQSAILGTGGIADRAVVREGQIVIRPIMTYSFTYDHRLIDGAVAARFMNSLIELLEKPQSLV